MRSILCYLVIILVSCNSTSTEPKIASATSTTSDQQKKIDSLTNVLNEKEQREKKDQEVKEKQKAINALINERNSIFTKVTTDKPAFTPVSLGGFKDIRFNLFNDSKYQLDQVVLKVHYIKANGSEIKSETLIESNIPANSRKALTAPDYTYAGTYLSVTIETLLCRAIDLCYYASTDSIASNDPYKCR